MERNGLGGDLIFLLSVIRIVVLPNDFCRVATHPHTLRDRSGSKKSHLEIVLNE